jgi:cytochrome c
MKKLTIVGAALLLGSAMATAKTNSAPPDPARGRVQFARCQSCHSLDPAVQRGIGPNLAGIVGKQAGRQSGFRYSRGLAGASFRWTPERLDAFLAKPREIVPGTTMVFSGIPDPEARRALIAYMAAQKR